MWRFGGKLHSWWMSTATIKLQFNVLDGSINRILAVELQERCTYIQARNVAVMQQVGDLGSQAICVQASGWVE